MLEKSFETLLNNALLLYNQPDFIANDPIQIPHSFVKPQDVEIAAFFASMLAWGRRDAIIKSANKLMNIFERNPHEYIISTTYDDFAAKLGKFAHRTIQQTDILYCFRFLKHFYNTNDSLESAFLYNKDAINDVNIENHLNYFYNLFFGLENPLWRTKKHITCPANGSACKRLCMMLRWLVRKDDKNVDLGIWNNIKPSQLILPLDVHTFRISKSWNLTKSNSPSWKVAVEITNILKQFDKLDPVKYDFVLFSLDL
jgi:uncharacterized protein (TIGR02757 family)